MSANQATFRSQATPNIAQITNHNSFVTIYQSKEQKIGPSFPSQESKAHMRLRTPKREWRKSKGNHMKSTKFIH